MSPMERIKQLPLWGVYALLAYMPFSLFISRWLSTYTGGLGIWDSSKDIVTLFLLAVALIVARGQGLFRNKTVQGLFLVVTAYSLLHLAFILFDSNDQDFRSWTIATLYNCRFLAYAFIAAVAGFGLNKLPLRTIIKIVVTVSTVTCLFAFIQYLAPSNLMTHFGYSIERGAKPSFFIDDKPDFPRVMSTVRDPNSYGAYLILPLSLLWALILKRSSSHKLLIPLLLIHGLALLLTFSRGAWLGAAISGLLVSGYIYKNKITSLIKKYYIILAVLSLCIMSAGFVLRDSYVFQNVILHSDESTVMDDPNELRIQLQNKAVQEIADDPEGHGPGTAGLVSIGNPKGTFLTENYYLQIGYEIGVLGLALFMSILVLVYRSVTKDADSGLRAVLIGSFWAYGFISLLIHLWSNEAVAAQWWLLAGLVAGATIRNNLKNKNVV